MALGKLGVRGVAQVSLEQGVSLGLRQTVDVSEGAGSGRMQIGVVGKVPLRLPDRVSLELLVGSALARRMAVAPDHDVRRDAVEPRHRRSGVVVGEAVPTSEGRDKDVGGGVGGVSCAESLSSAEREDAAGVATVEHGERVRWTGQVAQEGSVGWAGGSHVHTCALRQVCDGTRARISRVGA